MLRSEGAAMPTHPKIDLIEVEPGSGGTTPLDPVLRVHVNVPLTPEVNEEVMKFIVLEMSADRIPNCEKVRLVKSQAQTKPA
jgi:hypothetical protein